MTTERDHGRVERAVPMVDCHLDNSHLYPTLVLALRDMRTANGRDPDTGVGEGNESWIGLSIGMIVLDTLTGVGRDPEKRWRSLLTAHDIAPPDARIIYRLRCSLLHGYGLPKPEQLGYRRVLLTSDHDAYAVDTSRPTEVLLSVPVFCCHVVERIAAQSPGNWDTSLVNTNVAIDDKSEA